MPAKCAESALPLRFFGVCRKTCGVMESTPQRPAEGNEKNGAAPFDGATKSPLKSRAIIGGVAVVATAALRQAGVEIGDAELTDLLSTVVYLIGGLLAIIGRWKARAVIR